MVRPRKDRLVRRTPPVEYFKPRSIPMRELQEACLPLEGFEALRLADVQGLTQEEAAEHMGVSRHTFGRVLGQARSTVAQAIVSGWALRIEGGDYRLHHNLKQKLECDSATANKQGSCMGDRKVDVNLMAKIAISSEGPNLADQVDPRFGRAAGFLIMDQADGSHTYVQNGENQTRSQGAGIAAAELMAKNGVSVVLTGYVGPKAFQALKAVGIQVGQDLEGSTVEEALKLYEQGKVTLASGPNR